MTIVSICQPAAPPPSAESDSLSVQVPAFAWLRTTKLDTADAVAFACRASVSGSVLSRIVLRAAAPFRAVQLGRPLGCLWPLPLLLPSAPFGAFNADDSILMRITLRSPPSLAPPNELR